MSKKQETAVAKRESAEILPFDYGQDAGVGLDLTLDDLLVPFIKLLQDDSKELDEDEPNYVEGAAKGQILNMATKQYVDNLELIPAMKTRSYVEFLPDRGGFVAEHKPQSEVVQRALKSGQPRNELKTETGNPLVETKSLICIVNENDKPVGYVVVPFTSSKLSVWSEFFTLVDSFRVGDKKFTDIAPLFSLRINLSTVFVKNTKGKFYNYKITPAKGGIKDSLIGQDHPSYQAAKGLVKAFAEGRADTDKSTMDGGADKGEAASGDRHF